MSKLTRIPLRIEAQTHECKPRLRDILGESGTQLSDREKGARRAHETHLLNIDTAIAVMPADWLFGEWTSREKFQ